MSAADVSVPLTLSNTARSSHSGITSNASCEKKTVLPGTPDTNHMLSQPSTDLSAASPVAPPTAAAAAIGKVDRAPASIVAQSAGAPASAVEAGPNSATSTVTQKTPTVPDVARFSAAELAGDSDDEVDWERREAPSLARNDLLAKQLESQIGSYRTGVPSNIPAYKPSAISQMMGGGADGKMEAMDGLQKLIAQMGMGGGDSKTAEQAKQMFADMYKSMNGQKNSDAPALLYALTEDGKRVLTRGSPEFIVWKLTDSVEDTPIDDFRFGGFATRNDLMAAAAHGVRRKWLAIDQSAQILRRTQKSVKDDTQDELLRASKLTVASVSTSHPTTATSALPAATSVTAIAPAPIGAATEQKKNVEPKPATSSAGDTLLASSVPTTSDIHTSKTESDLRADTTIQHLIARGFLTVIVSPPTNSAAAVGTSTHPIPPTTRSVSDTALPGAPNTFANNVTSPTPTTPSSGAPPSAKRKKNRKKGVKAAANGAPKSTSVPGEAAAEKDDAGPEETNEERHRRLEMEKKMFAMPKDAAVPAKPYNREEALAAMRNRKQMSSMVSGGRGGKQAMQIMGKMKGMTEWAGAQMANKSGPDKMAEGTGMLANMVKEMVPADQQSKVRKNMPMLLEQATGAVSTLFGGPKVSMAEKVEAMQKVSSSFASNATQDSSPDQPAPTAQLDPQATEDLIRQSIAQTTIKKSGGGGAARASRLKIPVESVESVQKVTSSSNSAVSSSAANISRRPLTTRAPNAEPTSTTATAASAAPSS